MTTAPRSDADPRLVGPPAGLSVDGYRLLTRIGEGGMGVVHLAQRPGGKRVALKVLRPHIVGDDEARARLAREVNSLSLIRAPGVAEIVDADPWGDIPYVATRYVPGLSLHDHVAEEGPISAADLPWFALRLAEALAAVHAQGVLHRDIKPSNVLMEGRAPILIDFGLARVADDPKLTHTGWLLGTPGYLAPEILHGEDASAASDVHSWAATVAFAGLGEPPFGRGPAMAVMDRVRRGEHQITRLPEQMQRIVAAALDPEPRQRPGLAEVIGRLRELDAVPTRPPVEDVFTAPLALAAHHAPTFPTAPRAPEVERTRVLTSIAPQAPIAPPAPDAPPALPAPVAPERLSGLARARAAALLLLGTAASGALVAAYPYLAAGGLLVVAWLLRSGSLAASAAVNRRLIRGGARWYDAPQLLLSTPWHLIQSVPGTGLLALWGVGLATAAGLLGYAFAVGLAWTLAAAGGCFAVALWLGPGGRRVRGPAGRALRPLAAHPGRSAVAAVVLLGVTGAAAYSVTRSGPDFAPAEDHLFAGLVDGPDAKTG